MIERKLKVETDFLNFKLRTEIEVLEKSIGELVEISNDIQPIKLYPVLNRITNRIIQSPESLFKKNWISFFSKRHSTFGSAFAPSPTYGINTCYHSFLNNAKLTNVENFSGSEYWFGPEPTDLLNSKLTGRSESWGSSPNKNPNYNYFSSGVDQNTSSDFICENVWDAFFEFDIEKTTNDKFHLIYQACIDEITKRITEVKQVLNSAKKYRYIINKRKVFRAIIHCLFKNLDDEPSQNYLYTHILCRINNLKLNKLNNERYRKFTSCN